MDLTSEPAPVAPSRPAMKFTFASGSRPLDGYTIKRGIGQGGFGEVYYATSDAGKEVALKLIRRNLDVELRGVTQCLNLKHPHLLSLYDVKLDPQGDNWVVMEYVAGQSLEDELARKPNGLSIDEAVTWFRGIAAGVAHLHDRGVVHRDLKPGNIFNDEGQVKIGDYGLSKFISASRRSGQTESVGTVHYMAPEIANGRYGKEIDIYALGVILYELLSGQVPFDGETVGEVLMKHLTAEPDVSRLPGPFQPLVAKMLVKDPQQRLHSVAEVLALLPGANGAALPPPLATQAIPPGAVLPPRINEGAASPVTGQKSTAHQVSEVTPAKVLALLAGAVVLMFPLYLAVEKGTPWRLALLWFALLGFIGAVATTVVPQLRSTVRDAAGQLVAWWVKQTMAFQVVVSLLVGYLVLSLLFLPYAGTPFAYSGRIPSAVLGGCVLAGLVLAVHMFARMWHGGKYRQSSQAAHGGAGFSSQPLAPVVQPNGDRGAPAPRVERAGTRFVLPAKGARQIASELLTSLLLAVAFSAVISLLVLLLRRDTLLPEYVWLALVGAAGAWGVLIPAKFWEGREGDPTSRRFTLLCGGLLLGLFAFGMDQMLLVNLTNEFDIPSFADANSNSRRSWTALGLHDVEGQPELALYLAYFGFLYLAMRWWLQADPLRPVRLNLIAVLMTVVCAALLDVVLDFPQPWGVMAAGTISCVVQLSSPWVEHEARKAARAAA